MVNQIVRLIAPRCFDIVQREVPLDGESLVLRPSYLAICAADQRYYKGLRKKEILDKKLPLSLIHEAVGEVLYDPKKEFAKGTSVVMIPNTPYAEDDIIKENYRLTSKFRSSSMDGFMQNLVLMDRSRVIPTGTVKPNVAVLSELVSVAVNGVERFEFCSHERRNSIGVWGDGSVGYIVALVLKTLYPNAKIYVIGTRAEKLRYFSFVDGAYSVNHVPENLKFDHAFECVGGRGSGDAVDQIIDHIEPQGSIGLMGVSEDAVPINTRMVLEKGLILFGNSRSGRTDFEKSVELLRKKRFASYAKKIINEVVPIGEIGDVYTAFNNDVNNPFKTVMRWEM